MSIAREAALQALLRYEEAGAHLRETLEDLFRDSPGLSARDKAFCRDLVGGTVRRLNTLDWALDLFAESTVGRLSAPVRNLLRLGAYQILYMADRVPAYAAVHETVDSAKKHSRPGVVSFVNGLLRNLKRQSKSLPWPNTSSDPVGTLSLRHSHPAWLVRRWLDRWGADECAALLVKNNEAPWMSVRVNTLLQSRAELFRRLVSEGVEPEASRFSLAGLKFLTYPSLGELASFRDGGFQVQDEASQLVTDVLDPQPGETVADLCAGPGGKCTHIAERMANRGNVLAFDVNPHRLHLLGENCERLGIRIVQSFLLDGREAARKYLGEADRVLVDAPCSGLGVLRRRPDLRWNKQGRDILETFPALQRELLKSGALCVKPDGVLVYATCTLEPEENERVVEKFLEESPHMRAEAAHPYLASALKSALTPEGFVRLLPHRHDMDGFFIARFRKNL